jgi:hypothetical protein
MRLLLVLLALAFGWTPVGLRAAQDPPAPRPAPAPASELLGVLTAVDLPARTFTLGAQAPTEAPDPLEPAAPTYTIAVTPETVITGRDGRRLTLEVLARRAARRPIRVAVTLVDAAAPAADGPNVAARVVVGPYARPVRPPKRPRPAPAPDQPDQSQPASPEDPSEKGA